jgi:hypothetical protein
MHPSGKEKDSSGFDRVCPIQPAETGAGRDAKKHAAGRIDPEIGEGPQMPRSCRDRNRLSAANSVAAAKDHPTTLATIHIVDGDGQWIIGNFDG